MAIPRELLNDIKNFKQMKKQIIKKYEDYSTEADKYGWILNDIAGYYNDDLAYINGITPNNITRVNRLFIIKHNKNKYRLCNAFHDNFVSTNEIKHLKKLFNRSLGCLTPKEREEFLDSI